MSRPLALPIRCPECKRRPPIRLLPVLASAALDMAGDEDVMTWLCRCGTLHRITARDVLDAA